MKYYLGLFTLTMILLGCGSGTPNVGVCVHSFEHQKFFCHDEKLHKKYQDFEKSNTDEFMDRYVCMNEIDARTYNEWCHLPERTGTSIDTRVCVFSTRFGTFFCHDARTNQDDEVRISDDRSNKYVCMDQIDSRTYFQYCASKGK